MNVRAMKFCAWMGLGCPAVFLVGFMLIAGLVPPPSPSDTAAQTAAFYRENTTSLRVGLIISCIGAALTGPWVAAMTMQLRRIEGRYSVLTLTQFAMGTLLVLEFIITMFFWQVAAFRTDRSDESIQLLNDVGWVPFIGLTSTAIIQCWATAAVILLDKREQPVLPRWVAYFNIWVGLCFVPGSFNVLFKDGPIAWDGILSFYVAFAAFVVWYFGNGYACWKAADRLKDLEGAALLEILDEDHWTATGSASQATQLSHQVEALQHEVSTLRTAPTTSESLDLASHRD